MSPDLALGASAEFQEFFLAQDAMPKLERKHEAAADERTAANSARAKLEVDVTDLEEQIEKHEQTQAGFCAHPPLIPVQMGVLWVLSHISHSAGLMAE